MKRRKQAWLFSKLTILIAVFITLISLILLGIVYFWSYYYFGKIFEDKIIDEYTYEENEARGVHDEWILGVTAHSIVLVEAIHGEETAEHILEKAKKQTEDSHMYREKVNGNYLMYRIDLDYENGEKVYKYSIVKDIYRETFPNMLVWFGVFAVIILLLSILFTRTLTNKLYTNIRKLKDYIRRATNSEKENELILKTEDKDMQELASTFMSMQHNLQEKDKAQQEMLQYISHELKTPLMIINSYAEAAKNEVYPRGDIVSTLNTITAQTGRLQDKVEDLLFITKAKGEALKAEEEIQLVHVDKVVEEVVEHLQYKAQTKHIHIDLPQQMPVIGYRHKLEILVENLVDNQLKYSETIVDIRGRKEEGKMTLLFHNDGKRMDAATKEQLFTPFAKGEEGEHGLGLSIARKIAQQHNGDITFVDSESGTTFKVVIGDVTKNK